MTQNLKKLPKSNLPSNTVETNSSETFDASDIAVLESTKRYEDRSKNFFI